MTRTLEHHAEKMRQRNSRGKRHGYSAYTNNGCRCRTCRNANTQYTANYRQMLKERERNWLRLLGM